MITTLYGLLVCTAFFIFLCCFFQNDPGKLIHRTSLPLISAILFMILAMNSMSIIHLDCHRSSESSLENSTITNIKTVETTYQSSCNEVRLSYPYLGGVFGFFSLFSIILAVIRIVTYQSWKQTQEVR